MHKTNLFKIALFFSLSVFYQSGISAPLTVTQTVAVPTGLVEMPSARMFPDGEFSIHYSQALPYSRYVVTGQPLPWLQVLFKYTDIGYKDYPASKGKQNFKDKSTDVKVRLFEEDYFWPEVTAGINDVGGTGIFSGEYLALSKQVDRFDFTVGMGWGYLGSRGHLKNPLTYLSSQFKTRPGRTKFGGTVNPLNFFSGEKVSLFAGMEYHLESMPMTLKFEYDANDYQSEPFGEKFEVSSPFNVGLVYSYNRHLDFHAGIVRGNEYSLGLTLRTNFNYSGSEKILDEVPVAVYDPILNPKPEGFTTDWKQVRQEINDNSGIDAEKIDLYEDKIVVKGRQNYFIETGKGVGRASRILTNHIPAEVKSLVFAETYNGVEISAVKVNRDNFDRVVKFEVDHSSIDNLTALIPHSEGIHVEKNNKPTVSVKATKPRFDYFVAPSFSGSLGGPEAFLLYQLGIAANANYFVRENTWLSGSLELGLADNFEEFVYAPSPVLHRVRTNIKAYLKTSDVRIPRIQVTDFERFGDNLFLLSYAGYFESMYGGLGAEVLYRPYDADWALGLDVNAVKQREFDQAFGFRDYSVYTGHLTGYYELQNNLLFKLSFGRYLAKDIGATIDVSRKFKSGAELGFWATGTNVSAKDFSEGSFDKGFYFRIPMNLFTFKSTTETARFNWKFLTRDGGQKLARKFELYEITKSRRSNSVNQSFSQLLH